MADRKRASSRKRRFFSISSRSHSALNEISRIVRSGRCLARSIETTLWLLPDWQYLRETLTSPEMPTHSAWRKVHHSRTPNDRLSNQTVSLSIHTVNFTDYLMDTLYAQSLALRLWHYYLIGSPFFVKSFHNPHARFSLPTIFQNL